MQVEVNLQDYQGLAYRTDANGQLVVDEFGTGAIGQGKVNIVNKRFC